MPKPIEFELNGQRLRFDSEEDAARFFAALSSGNSAAKPAPAVEKPPFRLNIKSRITAGPDMKMAYAFLDAIRKAGSTGATSEEVAASLGIEAKGIGSRLRRVKAVMHDLHIEADEAFYRQKIPGKGRFWKPRDGIVFDEAHTRLKQLVAGG